jgi:hypothetical protein
MNTNAAIALPTDSCTGTDDVARLRNSASFTGALDAAEDAVFDLRACRMLARRAAASSERGFL